MWQRQDGGGCDGGMLAVESGKQRPWRRRPSCWPSSIWPTCGCGWSDGHSRDVAAGRSPARRAPRRWLRWRRVRRKCGGHACVDAGSCGLPRPATCHVDEQHRFGVHQRLALRDKGASGQSCRTADHDRHPHPAHAGHGRIADLDVSAIDELPPGRTPVQTIALSGERRPELVSVSAPPAPRGARRTGSAP